jgi:hypothetical protein
MIRTHGMNLPNTYARGSTPIDGLFVSYSLSQCSSGYTDIICDHRMLWIDVPVNLALGYLPLAVAQPSPKCLILQDPRITTKYNKLLQDFLKKYDVLNQIQTLENEINGKMPPLGMFIRDNGWRYSIRGHYVANLQKHAKLLAHPDPNHYMHHNAHRVVAHSLRVSACVALHNAGVSLDDITFCLRWNSDAVKAYICDCARTVDELTGRVISGAYMG